jgi:prepilin-type N-terminal cleavage/methylation domain-containing protein
MPQLFNLKVAQKGFTLAETLIALALIGVVGALVIPKLFTSQGQAVGRASVREAFVTVGELCLKRQQETVSADFPALDWGTNVAQQMENYMANRLNVRRCAAVGETVPCEFEFQTGVLVTSIVDQQVAGVDSVVITFNGGNGVGNFQMMLQPNASTINATYPEGYATRYVTGPVANAVVNQILNVQ